jgi:PAS domain S-box-containing protein
MLTIELRQEITEKFERQARLFEKTLSAITDFVYIIDRDGRFLYANKALLNLWGLTLDEAIGKNFFDLKYPDDLAAKLQGQIQQVCASRESLSDETEYISPSGVARHYEYIFSPVLGADGTVEAVAGSTREITERKRAEAELIEAKRAAEFANQSKDRFPEKGTIRVTTAPEAHGRWEMRVRDSGIGIPEEALRRIFDAFEQASANVTRQFGGLGLGLAVSKALVELYRGTIRAESAGPGHGSTFIVDLPYELS